MINETAFLLMDLDHRKLSGLGNRFLNRYLDYTQDYEGLRMLDFYLAYRACVRAKVACFLLDDSEISDAERASARDRAADYFAQAETYLSPRSRPGLVLMAGVSGSGKSTVAADLAEEIGGVVIRSDAVRKSLAGLFPDERSPADGGGGLYSDGMTERTYSGMLDRAAPVTESGRWAILDATYARSEFRREAFHWAEKQGLPFAILHCDAPISLMEDRLVRRSAEGRDASDADIQIMRRQIESFGAFDPMEIRSVVTVRTDQEWSGTRLAEALSLLMRKPVS